MSDRRRLRQNPRKTTRFDEARDANLSEVNISLLHAALHTMRTVLGAERQGEIYLITGAGLFTFAQVNRAWLKILDHRYHHIALESQYKRAEWLYDASLSLRHLEYWRTSLRQQDAEREAHNHRLRWFLYKWRAQTSLDTLDVQQALWIRDSNAMRYCLAGWKSAKTLPEETGTIVRILSLDTNPANRREKLARCLFSSGREGTVPRKTLAATQAGARLLFLYQRELRCPRMPSHKSQSPAEQSGRGRDPNKLRALRTANYTEISQAPRPQSSNEGADGESAHVASPLKQLISDALGGVPLTPATLEPIAASDGTSDAA